MTIAEFFILEVFKYFAITGVAPVPKPPPNVDIKITLSESANPESLAIFSICFSAKYRPLFTSPPQPKLCFIAKILSVKNFRSIKTLFLGNIMALLSVTKIALVFAKCRICSSEFIEIKFTLYILL